MKVSIASDHGGYELKEFIKNKLSHQYEFIDKGCFSKDSVDYPIYASLAAEDLSNGIVDNAIVICTNGVGVSMVANKVKGVRCALCLNIEMASHAKLHNDANCLALGQVNQSMDEALNIVKTFLGTNFSNEERHLRRVNQIKKMEEK